MIKRLLAGFFYIITITAIIIASWYGYALNKKVKSLTEKINNIEWGDQGLVFFLENKNIIVLDVGVIQFFQANKNTYSITINSIDYNTNGVSITGEFGNPNNFYLYRPTFKCEARQVHENLKDDFFEAKKNKKDIKIIDLMKQVGEGQVFINSIRPGGLAKFKMTMSNLNEKEFKNSLFFILLSGEAYSY